MCHRSVAEAALQADSPLFIQRKTRGLSQVPTHMLRNTSHLDYLSIVMDYCIPDPQVAEDITPERMVMKRTYMDNPSKIFIDPIEKVLAANIRQS
jgi:hypothetical protein